MPQPLRGMGGIPRIQARVPQVPPLGPGKPQPSTHLSPSSHKSECPIHAAASSRHGWDTTNPSPGAPGPAFGTGEGLAGCPIHAAASSRHGWETTNPNRVPQARGPHGHRGPRRAIFARWGEVRSSSVGRRSRLWDLGPQHRARNRVNSTAPLFPANPIDNQMERR